MHKQVNSKYKLFIKINAIYLFWLLTTLYALPLHARSENSSIPAAPSPSAAEVLHLQEFRFESGESGQSGDSLNKNNIEITTGEIDSPETLALAQQWAKQAFRNALRENPNTEISALSVVDADATTSERDQALSQTLGCIPAEAAATVGDNVGQTEIPQDFNKTINGLNLDSHSTTSAPSFYDRHYRKFFSFYRMVSVTGATTAALVLGGKPSLGALLVGTMGGVMSGSLQYQSKVVRYYVSGFPIKRVLATLIPQWATSLGVQPITDKEPTPRVSALASTAKKISRWYSLEVAYMTATAATAAIVSKIFEMPGIAPGHTFSAVAFSILATSAISILTQGIPDLAILQAHEFEIKRAEENLHLSINRRTDLKTMVVSAITMGLGIANLCGAHGMKYGLAAVGALGAAYLFKTKLRIKKTQDCEAALVKSTLPNAA